VNQTAVNAPAVHAVAAALDAHALELERIAADLRARARELREAKPARADARRLLRVRDLAELLQVDERTIRRWRDERRLPEPVVIAGVLRWRAEDIDAWLGTCDQPSLSRARAG